MIDVAFFYINLGRKWWKHQINDMIASARETQPGCRVFHYGDADTGRWPTADGSQLATEKIDVSIMMVAKAFMWGQAGMAAERPMVLTDADVLFKRDMEPLFEGDWDVGLLWRGSGQASLAQPFLAAMALTKPTPGARLFWQRYVDVAGNLPKAWHSWWVDQVALGIVLGTVHARDGFIQAPDFRVKLFPATLLAPSEEIEGAYAVHFKGLRAEKRAA